MALDSNQVWANGVVPPTPLDGAIAAGFACGEADPDVFNWILKEYGEAIRGNQTNIAGVTDRIDAQDDAIGNIGNAVNQLSGTLTALSDRTSPIATTTQFGLSPRLANTTEVTDLSSGQNPVRVGDLRTFRDVQGTLSLLYHPSARYESVVPAPDAADLNSTNLGIVANVTDISELRGMFIAMIDRVEDATGTVTNFQVPLEMFWARNYRNDPANASSVQSIPDPSSVSVRGQIDAALAPDLYAVLIAFPAALQLQLRTIGTAPTGYTYRKNRILRLPVQNDN